MSQFRENFWIGETVKVTSYKYSNTIIRISSICEYYYYISILLRKEKSTIVD